MMEELRKFVDDLVGGRIEWSPEEIAKAAAAEKRMREHPMTDAEAIAAGVAFITFTPLGGE